MKFFNWFKRKPPETPAPEVKVKIFTPDEAAEAYKQLDFVGEEPPSWFVKRVNEILKVKSTNNPSFCIAFYELCSNPHDQVRKWVIYLANYGWDIKFVAYSLFRIEPSSNKRGSVKYS